MQCYSKPIFLHIRLFTSLLPIPHYPAPNPPQYINISLSLSLSLVSTLYCSQLTMLDEFLHTLHILVENVRFSMNRVGLAMEPMKLTMEPTKVNFTFTNLWNYVGQKGQRKSENNGDLAELKPSMTMKNKEERSHNRNTAKRLTFTKRIPSFWNSAKSILIHWWRLLMYMYINQVILDLHPRWTHIAYREYWKLNSLHNSMQTGKINNTQEQPEYRTAPNMQTTTDLTPLMLYYAAMQRVFLNSHTALNRFADRQANAC